MRLVVVIAFCATLVALAVVVIVVPTTINSVRRAHETAEIESLSLHKSAIDDVSAKVERLVASTKLWIDVLERSGGMDIPWSLQDIFPFMWGTLRDNPVVEQLTFGAVGDEGIAMDDPISLEGWEPTSTVLKVKIQNHPQYPEWACRGYYAWNSEQPANFSRSRFLKDKCSYSYPLRGWFRKITAMTKNVTATGGDDDIVATEIEPNFHGEYTTAAAGRYIRSRRPTQNPTSTMEGVGAVDFSTRVITQAFSNMKVSKNGVAGIFVVANINRGDLVGIAPASEPIGRRANASDPTSEMVGLKQWAQLSSGHLFHKNGAAIINPILLEGRVNATQTRKMKGSEGEPLLVNYADIYAMRGTLHWRVIMLTPEKDFTAEVTAERNLTLGICIPIALLCIVFQCVVMYMTVARPLERVSDAMGATANLQEHEDLQETAFITEIEILQREYSHLRDAVMCVKAYVPQSLIQEMAEAEEEAAIAVADSQSTRSRHSSRSSVRSRKSGGTGHSSSQLERNSAHSVAQPAADVVVANHPGLNLSMGTHRQRITVLACNLQGYHRAVSHLDSLRLSDYMSNIVTTVSQIATNLGGVVDLFHGDHFYLTFNAIRRLSSHAQAAAQASLALKREIPQLGPCGLKMACGFSTGLALIGNLGSSAMRRFCHVGSPFTQATVLERASRLYEGEGGLTIENTFPSIEAHFYFECVDMVRFAGHRRPQVIAVVQQEISKDMPARGVNQGTGAQNANGGGDDEWMYLVNRQDAQNPYWHTNKAFLNLAHGSLGQAQQIRDECRAVPGYQQLQAEGSSTPLRTSGADGGFAGGGSASGDAMPNVLCSVEGEQNEVVAPPTKKSSENSDENPAAENQEEEEGAPTSADISKPKRKLISLLAMAEAERLPCSDWGVLYAIQ